VSATVAVRLDFGRVLLDDSAAVRRAAEVMSRPSFDALDRVSARRKDRWLNHAKRGAEVIAEYLSDPKNDSAFFDTKRGSELVATGEIENGLRGRTPEVRTTAVRCHVVLPMPHDGVERLIADVLELAGIVATGAGFVGVEPDYGLAHRHALGGSRPKERTGLSELRQRGRRAREWKSELIATHLATVEWGTLLGAGYLDRIDLAKIRASGAFARVVDVSPELAFLQVTADPRDDLTGELEAKLPAARHALAPLLMDISDVNLD